MIESEIILAFDKQLMVRVKARLYNIKFFLRLPFGHRLHENVWDE